MSNVQKTHQKFVEEIKILHPDLEIVGKYINAYTRILVKNKYGLCNVIPSTLLNKFKPSIKIAVNKTEY
jgi:hypothetical protein